MRFRKDKTPLMPHNWGIHYYAQPLSYSYCFEWKRYFFFPADTFSYLLSPKVVTDFCPLFNLKLVQSNCIIDLESLRVLGTHITPHLGAHMWVSEYQLWGWLGSQEINLWWWAQLQFSPWNQRSHSLIEVYHFQGYQLSWKWTQTRWIKYRHLYS